MKTILLLCLVLALPAMAQNNISRGTQPPDLKHVTMQNLNDWLESSLVHDINTNNMTAGFTAPPSPNSVTSASLMQGSVTSNALAQPSVYNVNIATNAVNVGHLGLDMTNLSKSITASVVATNGLSYWPSGLLEQWGVAQTNMNLAPSGSAGSFATQVVAYPITYTNFVVPPQVWVQPSGTNQLFRSGADEYHCYGVNVGTNNFTIYIKNGGTATNGLSVYWRTIGK